MSAPIGRRYSFRSEMQPYLAQPYPTHSQPYPAAGAYPSSQPPAYSAACGYGAPEAPPPAYGVGPSAFANQTVPPTTTVVTIQEDPNITTTDDMFSFKEKSVRLGFIGKVFASLALQMAVTVGLSCLFIFHKPTKDFVQENIRVYYSAYALFFFLVIVVLCAYVARIYPCNMILLGVFTLILAYMVAAISSFHDTKIVLMVFVITLVVCSAVMIFTCQTKYDFTTFGGLLFVLCLSLLLFGIFAGIFVPIGGIRILNMAYAGVGALFFMGFLVVDTQLIIARGKYEINPEDYAFAAMMLYVDMVYIFLYLFGILLSVLMISVVWLYSQCVLCADGDGDEGDDGE